jgi:hypothetical protein
LVITRFGVGLTNTFLVAKVVPHEPPLVVSVNVAVPVYAGGGVHVALRVVAVGLKVPPAGVDHVPPVALPPTDPPRAAVVPPWQMAAMAGPIFTVGLGLTTTFFVAKVVPQDPPLVVRVSVAVPVYAGGGVHVALRVVAVGLKVPPAGVVQVPPVAPPPTDPPRAAVVPPWQMAAMAGPALTVGLGLTTTFFVANVVPQEPPLVVRVSVAVPL